MLSDGCTISISFAPRRRVPCLNGMASEGLHVLGAAHSRAPIPTAGCIGWGKSAVFFFNGVAAGSIEVGGGNQLFRRSVEDNCRSAAIQGGHYMANLRASRYCSTAALPISDLSNVASLLRSTAGGLCSTLTLLDSSWASLLGIARGRVRET